MQMKKKNLTEKERYYIEIALKKKMSVTQIAKDLGRHRSTIYKEIKKGLCMQIKTNFWKDTEEYCADVAERKAKENMARTGRKCKLQSTDEWLQKVKELIIKGRYSPEAVTYLIGHKVCVKTLYNYIHSGYIPGVNTLSLPYAEPRKKAKDKVAKRPYRKSRSIEERPLEINARKVYGHWEMDTVYSNRQDKTCLLVLTERKTREELIEQIPDRTALSVVRALNRIEKRLGAPAFRRKFKTITCDNGVEFSDWKGIEKSYLNKQIPRTTTYFCHPYSSSERGSNENQNKMIRRWIPKGDDIGLYSKQEIKNIESWINSYPRRMFSGMSTEEILNFR